MSFFTYFGGFIKCIFNKKWNMADQLKNVYNLEFFTFFTEEVRKVYPSFDKSSFIKQILNNNWDQLGLKERMHHISHTLANFLPSSYKKAVSIILDLIDHLMTNKIKMAFEFMFIPNFIEHYGINHYETSIHAFEKITQFTSCEFAVRPFIIKYPDKMMKQMLSWSKHPHDWVRRNASEGCRSRLPWAMALPDFKKDPSSILPILENLKSDDSEYVRKSIANNLNDISKDHPNIVLDLTKKWIGKSKNTDWVLKHGCRSLLKEGNSEALTLFGLGANDKIKLTEFELLTPQVILTEHLAFSFNLSNTDNISHKVRLEYAVYYQKANGSLSKKVYKISEKEYDGDSVTSIERKQSFKLISTRKFHLGLHQVSIIINGVESEKLDFNLVSSPE